MRDEAQGYDSARLAIPSSCRVRPAMRSAAACRATAARSSATVGLFSPHGGSPHGGSHAAGSVAASAGVGAGGSFPRVKDSAAAMASAERMASARRRARDARQRVVGVSGREPDGEGAHGALRRRRPAHAGRDVGPGIGGWLPQTTIGQGLVMTRLYLLIFLNLIS